MFNYTFFCTSIAFCLLTMSNLTLAAIKEEPLRLNEAKRYFDQPYSIFVRKWMDNPPLFESVYRVMGLKPAYDIRYRLEREYMSSDEGMIKNAVLVFGNYCALHQGILLSEYQDQLFCIKGDSAFAHIGWSSEWNTSYDHFGNARQSTMSTKFVMLSDVYANDAYRRTVQYRAPTRIIFSD